MDLAHALKVALETGKVEVGVRQSRKAAESGAARLVVVARSCPDLRLRTEPRLGAVPILAYPGSAVELGRACGRPYPISALAILEPGASAILTVDTR